MERCRDDHTVAYGAEAEIRGWGVVRRRLKVQKDVGRGHGEWREEALALTLLYGCH